MNKVYCKNCKYSYSNISARCECGQLVNMYPYTSPMRGQFYYAQKAEQNKNNDCKYYEYTKRENL